MPHPRKKALWEREDDDYIWRNLSGEEKAAAFAALRAEDARKGALAHLQQVRQDIAAAPEIKKLRARLRRLREKMTKAAERGNSRRCEFLRQVIRADYLEQSCRGPLGSVPAAYDRDLSGKKIPEYFREISRSSLAPGAEEGALAALAQRKAEEKAAAAKTCYVHICAVRTHR